MRESADWRARSNLPASLTSFVGRTREIGQLTEQLRRSRLLTLLGIGGIGKSRLALEVARAALNDLVQEARLVELMAVSEAEQVVGALVSALGVRDSGERPLQEALVASLGHRQVLLVLDNCERVVAAVADQARILLEQCPGLRILATSRIPLNVDGESRWAVEPLTVPNLTKLPPQASLTRYSAVRLFVERAQAVQPGFRLTTENATQIVRVCANLDGIPLAIELAAARVTVLHPSQLLERLADRFSVLTSPHIATHVRHRTLRGMIDWSHDLLAGPEQMLFRRLAVFVGGWTLEAAERVCSGDGIAREEVLDLLAQLVAHSLIFSHQRRGETRFGSLDTIRVYALSKLRDSGEEDHLLQRHMMWVHALARQADSELWTSAQRAWLDRLTSELENVRAALASSAAQPDVTAGLQIATWLWRFWEQRGRSVEGRQWIADLLARPQPGRSPVRAFALAMLSYFAFVHGELSVAAASAAEALELARVTDDQTVLILTLLVQGLMDGARGDLAASEADFQEALAVARAADWGPGVRMALQNLSVLERMRGGDQRALALLQEALALCDAAGDDYTSAFCLSALGHLALQRGDLDQAASCFRRTLTIWRDLEDVQNVSMSIEGLAWTVGAQGQSEQAVRLLGAAEAFRDAVGAVVLPHWQAAHSSAVAAARIALGADRFTATWAAGRALSLEQAISAGLRSDGQTAIAARRGARQRAAAGGSPLSRREAQVARLAAVGLTNRQIAQELVLQESTVGNHLQRIYARLGLNGRVQLAAWVAQHGRSPGT